MKKFIASFVIYVFGLYCQPSISAQNLANQLSLVEPDAIYRSVIGVEIILDLKNMLAQEGDLITTVTSCEAQALKSCIIVNDFPLIIPNDLSSFSTGNINRKFHFMYIPKKITFSLNGVAIHGSTISIRSNEQKGVVIGSIFLDLEGNIVLFSKENIVYFSVG